MTRKIVEPEIVNDASGADAGEEGETFEPVPLPADKPRSELPIRRLTLPPIPGDQLLSDDPLTTYLAQLRHIAPLTAEEQQMLAERYHEDKDVEAAQQLVMSNLRLVVKIAREYHRRRTNLMELVQEGNVGLAEAIRRYDPYRGVKFTSYAQYWIRAMILNYLMNVMQLVRVGSTRSGRKLFYNLQKAREQLIQQGFLNPSSRQLADHLGVKESEVVDVARILDAPTLSLDAPAPGHETGTMESVIPDEERMLPDTRVERMDIAERIRSALDRFRETIDDDRELAIWDRRVVADEPLSLQELGEEFEVSRERIRQVEKGLKERFKAFWIETVGEDEAAVIFED
ncbi:MAG: sigma-70 family RNA polymerase sigma factor [Deltaproteobacteria bacterium]|nr:MAG: sigma-70 family RNA polymerase sigma factor [Deltaproteobacteria bacterium]